VILFFHFWKGNDGVVEVCLIPGDGIGPEVARAATRVIEASGADITWRRLIAGEEAMEKEGTPLPQHVLDEIQNTKVALKGPITTPVGSGFRSVNVDLRKELSLFAGVRPAKTLSPTISRFGDVDIDIVVIRENTEGLYSGVEHFVDKERTAAETIRIITRASSEEIIRFAFNYAQKEGRSKVTLVHKANILKATCGLFLDVGRRVSADYPDIEFEDRIVDNMCMQLVRKPEQYDVIVCPNLFGDILSDLCAGLVGGLGVSPGANIGKECAVFEPVHGSAPKYKGLNKVNPIAMILSGAMMLKYLGMNECASRIMEAVRDVIADGKYLTYDLGGSAGTQEVSDAVVEKIERRL
jgi:isocitrate dehydrogenase (NAD+)